MRIIRPKIPLYYEIYRNDELWLTVLTWLDVLNFIFDDHVKTRGVFKYSFKMIDNRGS